MLTEDRWQKEQELMRSTFPEFAPFMQNSKFGFEGQLKGSKSGQIYRVVLEAEQKAYPQCPPSVFMNPRLGMYWIGADDRRRLCMQKEWRPARSTFANTLLGVIRFLDEFDPAPGSAQQANSAGAEDQRRLEEAGLNPEAEPGLSAVFRSRSWRLW